MDKKVLCGVCLTTETGKRAGRIYVVHKRDCPFYGYQGEKPGVGM